MGAQCRRNPDAQRGAGYHFNQRGAAEKRAKFPCSTSPICTNRGLAKKPGKTRQEAELCLPYC